LQLNAQHSRTVNKEIRQLSDVRNIDILILQEPYVRKGKLLGFPITAKIITKGDKPGAATIIFNRNITATLIDQYSNEKVLCTEIKTSTTKFILVNAYFQYGEIIDPYIDILNEILNNYQREQILIAADANAKSFLWNSSITDSRGEQLEDLIFTNNLAILNLPGNPPTFKNRAGASSNIDVTLATNTLASSIVDWKVEEDMTVSDHSIIGFKLEIYHNVEESENILTYNVNKLNWEKFRKKLKLPNISEGMDLHALTEELENKTIEAIQQTKSRSNVNFNKRNGGLPYWSNKLEKLKRKTRALRKSYLAARDPTIRQRRLQNYRIIKSEYEKELDEARKKCWERYIIKNVDLDPWGTPFKLAYNKIKNPTTLTTMKKPNNEMTSSWEETIELLLDVLLPDDKLNEDSQQQQIERIKAKPRVRKTNQDRTGIIVTNAEVELIISKLKSHKAPGPDCIKPEIIKNNKEIWVPYLARLYSECLKQSKFPRTWKQAKLIILLKNEDKDKTSPKSYRPICLLNIFGKMLERIIVNRINQFRPNLDKCMIQFGFRKGKSTEDAINRLLRIIENQDMEGRKYVLSVFVDITGAFDHLWWPALLNSLRKLGIPEYLWNTIYNYLQDREVFYESSGTKISKHPTKGCPQGSVCGPTFWDITIDPCLQKLNTHPDVSGVVAYADDIVIIVSADSRIELERKAGNAVSLLQNWCEENKLKISENKTKYILFKGKLKRNPIIKLNNANIKRVETIKYLGIHLDEKLNYNSHIQQICKSGLNATNKLITLAQGHFKIPIKIIRLYHQVVLNAIITYGASVWYHRILQNKKLADNINSVQRKILMRMTGAYNTVSNDALTILLGVTPLHLEVVKRGVFYWLKENNHLKIQNDISATVTSRQELEAWITTRWQNSWNLSTKGRRLYPILPNVEERLEINHLQPCRGLTHFLTGHGPYREKLKQLRIINDDTCACGQLDSPEHVVFHCPLTEDLVRTERQLLLNQRNPNLYNIIRDIEQYFILSKLANKISNYFLEKYKQEKRHKTISTPTRP
jgi:hypothetical protein